MGAEIINGVTAAGDFLVRLADGSAGDPVSIAKALTTFAKTNEDLIIKGGMLEGALLSTEEITALSKIAPREELLARLAGGMAAPLREFASLLNAVPQNFAYALSALIEAGGSQQESAETSQSESKDLSEDETEETTDSIEAEAEAEVEAETEAQTESEEEVPEEEPLENNKVDGEANENEES